MVLPPRGHSANVWWGVVNEVAEKGVFRHKWGLLVTVFLPVLIKEILVFFICSIRLCMCFLCTFILKRSHRILCWWVTWFWLMNKWMTEVNGAPNEFYDHICPQLGSLMVWFLLLSFCSSHLAEMGSSQALHMQLKYHCLDLSDYGALGLQQPLHKDIKLYAGVSVTLTSRSTAVTLGFLTR